MPIQDFEKLQHIPEHLQFHIQTQSCFHVQEKQKTKKQKTKKPYTLISQLKHWGSTQEGSEALGKALNYQNIKGTSKHKHRVPQKGWETSVQSI